MPSPGGCLVARSAIIGNLPIGCGAASSTGIGPVKPTPRPRRHRIWAAVAVRPRSLIREKINSIGTLRARLGWANAGWLWYVTGGVAWAEVNDTFTGSTSNPAVALNGNSVSFSQTKSGGTVGAGVETRLWGGWSAKLEYLYVNLGSTDRAFTTTNVFGDSATLASNHSLNDHMVRFGLNYRFW